MVERKISLEELAILNNGTCVDLDIVTGNDESALGLVKDEITDFLSKSNTTRAQKPVNSFYSTVPNTDLKKSIDSILKTKNIKEEILKKHAQYDFDRKMNRIKKIKSRTYRKMKRRDKLRKSEALEHGSNDLSDENSTEDAQSDENIHDFRPVLSFNNQHEKQGDESESQNTQNDLVAEAFEVPGYEGNEKEFLQEKSGIVKTDAPQLIESSLPGWDSWAGEGIEFQKTKFNTTIEKKEGIRNQDRADFGKRHVISNEHIAIPEKYLSILPYGFTSKDYKAKMNTPISLETNSLRIFNKFVKMPHKDDSIAGKEISPCEYDPEY